MTSPSAVTRVVVDLSAAEIAMVISRQPREADRLEVAEALMTYFRDKHVAEQRLLDVIFGTSPP